MIGGMYFDEDECVFVVCFIDGRCEFEYERIERVFDFVDGFEVGWLGRCWFWVCLKVICIVSWWGMLSNF